MNPAIVIAWVVAVPGVVAMIVIVAALAIYGVRRYVFTAKTGEAKAAVVELANGIARCHDDRGTLPPTTTPVPADLSSVAGMKCQSVRPEWRQPAFECASFWMTTPQYYQYSWELDPDGVTGYAVARGDLDGDGIQSEFRVLVECHGQCAVGSDVQESDALE